ncbi:MAG: carbohydrate ABC transporter permease [Bacillota bacterium]
MTPKIRELLFQLFTYIVLVAVGLIILFPCLIMLTTSLKADVNLFQVPIQWIPDPVMWSNYSEAFVKMDQIAHGLTFVRVLVNTLFITLLGMVSELCAVSVVAYGFARFRFTGRKVIFFTMLATMMLPGIICIIPSFMIWKGLGLIDTYDPLVTAAWLGGGAWAVFLMRQFMMNIPQEMEEAATIDGANTLQIFYLIIIPMIKPALLALGVLIFQGRWNDFMGPLIYINTAAKFPLVMAIKFFQESLSHEAPKWNYMMAVSAVLALPILILYFSAQRYFIEGLNVGAVKG